MTADPIVVPEPAIKYSPRVYATVSQTTGSQRREAGRPVGNRRKSSGKKPTSVTHTSTASEIPGGGSGISAEPASPAIHPRSAAGQSSDVTPIAPKIQPIGFDGWRVAMRAPTSGYTSKLSESSEIRDAAPGTSLSHRSAAVETTQHVTDAANRDQARTAVIRGRIKWLANEAVLCTDGYSRIRLALSRGSASSARLGKPHPQS